MISIKLKDFKILMQTMNIRQLADHLGVSYKTVYNFIRENGLESLKFKQGRPKKIIVDS